MRSSTSFAFCLALASSGLACGSLGNPSSQPVLSTLHGELTSGDTVKLSGSSSGVRVAVVWMGIGGGYSIAEDLPVQPVFPAQFRIDLTGAPPASAMVTKAQVTDSSPDGPGAPPPQVGPSPTPAPVGSRSVRPLGISGAEAASWPDDFGFAVGAVVAYDDLNGNGKLDLIDDAATAYVDRILGANGSMILTYFQGTFPADLRAFADGAGNLPVHGYSLFDMGSSCATTADMNTGAGSACNGEPAQWLSMSTLYTLPLAADPKWGSIMCKGGGGGFGSSGSTDVSADPGTSSGGADGTSGSGGGGVQLDAGLPDAQAGDGAVPPDPSLPSPNDPDLHCAPDGRSFTVCAPQPPPPPPSLCGAPTVSETSCGGRGLGPSATPPPNWPCPLH